MQIRPYEFESIKHSIETHDLQSLDRYTLQEPLLQCRRMLTRLVVNLLVSLKSWGYSRRGCLMNQNQQNRFEANFL